MKKISSRANEEIKSVTALHTTKERARQGKFIAEGLRVCTTLVTASVRCVQLYVLEEMYDQALKYANERSVTVVTESVMEKISTASTPSGMVGVFEIPRNPEPQ